MKVCLNFGSSDVWCDDDGQGDSTDDPRDATCSNCLRLAAAYGAAAAMRYAAVEAAGGWHDEELEKERDAALERLTELNKALQAQSAFFCEGCKSMHRLSTQTFVVGSMSWCSACTPKARTET